MYIDTHAHLTDGRFVAEDVIASFAADKLSFIINVGYDRATSEGSVKLAQKHPNVFAAVGIHPSDASVLPYNELEHIKRLINEKKVVAVGEIGLDYHYNNVIKERQEMFFVRQMEIAHEAKKPIIIHRRDDNGDVLKTFKSHRDLLSYGGVMHSYMEGEDEIDEFVRLGFYISFSGALTFKKNLEACLARVPLDRIMFETDCPYLTPAPYRGKQNYPKYVANVYSKAADILDIPVDMLCRLAEKNVKRLFNIYG